MGPPNLLMALSSVQDFVRIWSLEDYLTCAKKHLTYSVSHVHRVNNIFCMWLTREHQEDTTEKLNYVSLGLALQLD